MFSKIILVTIVLSALSLNAAEVQKRELRSEDGVQIQLEYNLVYKSSGSSNKPSSANYAQPLYFLVKHPQLKATDQVRIVLINRESFNGQCGLPSYTRDPHYIMDLKYSPSARGFVTDFTQARILILGSEVPLQPEDQRLQLLVNGYCNTVKTTQELAIVINGRWQTDPVNRTPNFKLDLLPTK